MGEPRPNYKRSREIYPGEEEESLLPQRFSSSHLAKNVSRRVDSTIRLTSALYEGHKGPVLCVDTSAGGDFIITGGQDCSIRVWKYFVGTFDCFKLVAVLCHDGEVAASAFVGDLGPIVGGDSTGGFVVWPMDEEGRFGGDHSLHKPHDGAAIRALKVKEGLAHDGSILVATAAETVATLSRAKYEGLSMTAAYSYRGDAMFHHDEEVFEVCHVPGNIHTGAALATCTAGGIHLWKSNGRKLTTVRDSSQLPMSTLSISNKEEGGTYFFMLAGTGPFVAVWALHDGSLVDGDGAQYPVDASPGPLVRYEANQDVRHVAIAVDNSFICVGKRNRCTEMYRIAAEGTGRAPLGPNEPASLLTADWAYPIFEERHDGDVLAIAIYNDPEGEATLLEALSDGSAVAFDLSGVDAGEQTIGLRSLTRLEVLTPIALLLVSFLQITSFAFGPATKWSDEVQKPLNITISMATMDFNFAMSIGNDQLFWGQVVAALVAMVFFALVALAGARESNFRCKLYARRNHHNCCAVFFGGVDSLLLAVMGLLSTVSVVPIYKHVTGAFDCVVDEHGVKVLREVPDVVCFEGLHKKLAIAIAVITPVYSMVLVPYFCVAGDANFMKLSQLIRPWLWKEAVDRKASCMHLHAMHPHCEHIFCYRLVELFAKIALPCTTIVLRAHPRLQMGVVSAIGGVLYVHTILTPPFADPFWGAVKSAAQLSIFTAMLCGLGSTLAPEEWRVYTTWWLLATQSVVLLISVVQLRSGFNSRNDYKVIVQDTDGALRMHLPELGEEEGGAQKAPPSEPSARSLDPKSEKTSAGG